MWPRSCFVSHTCLKIRNAINPKNWACHKSIGHKARIIKLMTIMSQQQHEKKKVLSWIEFMSTTSHDLCSLSLLHVFSLHELTTLFFVSLIMLLPSYLFVTNSACYTFQPTNLKKVKKQQCTWGLLHFSCSSTT